MYVTCRGMTHDKNQNDKENQKNQFKMNVF